MKKIAYLIAFMLISAMSVHAQVNPEWQGVLRGATDQKPVVNTRVSVQFTVSQQRSVLYKERHVTTTSPFGLIHLQICKGTPISGDCRNIGVNSGAEAPVLKVEIDPNGGSNYIDFGEMPLNTSFLSAYAVDVMQDQVNDADIDPDNELQTLRRVDDRLMLSGQNGQIELDIDTTNELQYLTLDATTRTIFLSDGNSVVVPPKGSDKDGSSNNEIQALRYINGDIALTLDGGSVTDLRDDADADPQNELQFMTFSDNALTISNGNTIDLSSIKPPSDVIWKEDKTKEIVYWDDPSMTRHIQFGKGGFQYGEGNGMRLTQLGDQEAEDYFRWTSPKFPDNSFYKSGMIMRGKPGWNYESYWQIDASKLLTVRLFHPNNSQTNGFAVSQMVLGSARGSAMIPNLLLQGAGTGAVYLLNPQDPTQAIAGLDVDPMTNQTRIFAQTKNFKESDPNHPQRDIWYTSIEGPEAAMYDRGTSKLIDGSVFVPLKKHFAAMASEGTYTVILSPLSAASKGLAVVEKRKDGFVVQELFDGVGNYTFEWNVKAVRKGFENFEVVRPKKETQVEYLKQSRIARRQ